MKSQKMKKQTLVLLIFCLIFTFPSFAADTYEKADYLYVWAKSGLNLRKSPTTKSAKIITLSFGQKVTVLEKIHIPFVIEGISAGNIEGNEKPFPAVEFSGHWVKIATETGESGYVIDQYLLKYEPEGVVVDNTSLLNLNVRQVDTLFKSPEANVGEGLYMTLKSSYDHGVEAINKTGGVWGETCYTIPNSSLEEVLVLFSAGYDNYSGFVVIEKRSDKIVLSGREGLCEYTISQKAGYVEFKIFCSC